MVEWEYVGELDEKDQMCGIGTLKYITREKQKSAFFKIFPSKITLFSSKKEEKQEQPTANELGYNDYEGTFLGDKFHGIGK